MTATWNDEMQNSELVWRFPPENCVLAPKETHVWCAPVDMEINAYREVATSLSTHDLYRASKLGSPQLKQRFLTSRALLRNILSRYLTLSAERISIVYSSSGKPLLDTNHRESGIRFSIAHSGDLTLIAITTNAEIGIDIERIRTMEMSGVIASQFFSKGERLELQNSPPGERLEGFFNCWTRKEAYLKAVGLKNLIEPNLIEVSIAAATPASILNVAGDTIEASQWSIRSLLPALGYVAALAVRCKGSKLSCFQLPETPATCIPLSYRYALSAQSN